MTNVTSLPEETTEVAAALIDLHRSRYKSRLKFGAFMVLLFVTVAFVLWVTASISTMAAPEIERRLEIFHGIQK